MYRMDDVSKGLNKPFFFSSKNEILLKLRHLTLNDVERCLKKVKEKMERYGKNITLVWFLPLFYMEKLILY